MAEALSSESLPLEEDSGVIRVRGTRVTLDSVWEAFNEGATAEEIVQQYPSLSLADAYQSIGYFLRHPSEVHEYLLRRSGQHRDVQASNEARWRPHGIRARLTGRHQR